MYGEEDEQTGMNARSFSAWDVIFCMALAVAWGAMIGAWFTHQT